MPRVPTAALIFTFSSLVACAPLPDGAESAQKLILASQESFVAELAAGADAALSPASRGFLNSMNSALDGIHDVSSALAAQSQLSILADRLYSIERLADTQPPSEDARTQAQQRLARVDAWTRFRANLERISADPDVATQLSEQLAELVAFFGRQNRRT